MSGERRIAVFYSEGSDYRKALAAVRRYSPEARICAVVPPGYGDVRSLEQLADEVLRTDREHYSPRNPGAVARLIRRLRAERYDGFVVLFDTGQLQAVAALSGAHERLWCRPDGRVVPLRRGPLGIVAEEAARLGLGRVRYAVAWMNVRFRRCQPR